MKNIERNLSLFLKKYQNPMTFIAMPFVVIGFLLHHTPLGFWLEDPRVIMVPCFLLATVLCGLPILFRAYMALKWKTISIELLVSLAVAGALFIGEYSECGIVTFLFQFGNYLEARTLAKTRNAIKDLVAYFPTQAILLTEAGQEEIDIDDVEVGDRLLVKEGGKVPVDGIIVQGEGYFSEAKITGESKQVHKKEGSFLYAGAILESGLVEMTASRVGEDTTYGKIVELVEEAEDAKSPVESFIDRFARFYTPFVIVAAVCTLLATRNIDTSVTVLVLACPGALVIGAPIASVSGIGKGAQNGILYKGGDVIHAYAKCDTFLFDKTGTLTYGDSRVGRCISYLSDSEDFESCLRLGAAAEALCSHPLGKAIQEYGRSKELVGGESKGQEVRESIGCAENRFQELEEWEGKLNPVTLKGQGIITEVYHQGKAYQMLMGNESLFADHGLVLSEEVRSDIQCLTSHGDSIVLQGFIPSEDGQACQGDKACISLLFGISDTLREGAKEALTSLERISHGSTCMLTGDHVSTASHVAEQLGMSQFQGDLLPDDKYRILCGYQQDGHRVCFVGDGINDSPSITKADTGIAMGNGTDVAIECSDIVILNSDIRMLAKALSLAKRTVAITMENIIIAIGTVLFLLVGLFAGYIHMSSGMLIHELSIFAVILNGMRLLMGKNGKEDTQ